MKNFNKYANYKTVIDYCNDIKSGKILANREQIQGVERFLKMLEDDRYELRPSEPEIIIKLIEKTIKHRQGEQLDGTPMRDRPFLLQPWHKYIIYNIVGFWHKGTNILKHHECFIYIPRKNTKTTFASSLAWALSIYFRKSGSKCYIVANAMQQARESFDFIKFNIEKLNADKSFIIKDSNAVSYTHLTLPTKLL